MCGGMCSRVGDSLFRDRGPVSGSSECDLFDTGKCESRPL